MPPSSREPSAEMRWTSGGPPWNRHPSGAPGESQVLNRVEESGPPASLGENPQPSARKGLNLRRGSRLASYLHRAWGGQPRPSREAGPTQSQSLIMGPLTMHYSTIPRSLGCGGRIGAFEKGVGPLGLSCTGVPQNEFFFPHLPNLARRQPFHKMGGVDEATHRRRAGKPAGEL
jgi:hypothetical protein